MKNKFLNITAFVILIYLVFRSWFSLIPISRGDLTYFFPEMFKRYLNFPWGWDVSLGGGLGGNTFLYVGNYFYNLPLGFLGQFLPYVIIQRLVWFFPILILGIVSPWFLSKETKIFPVSFYFVSISIFLLNTYALMIFGGAQITVALGYVLLSLCFYFFLKSVENNNLRNIIFLAFSLAFVIAYDFRLAYLTAVLFFLYLIFSLVLITSLFDLKKWGREILKIALVGGTIVAGIHAYWLLPFLLNYQNPVASLTSAYTTGEAVRFFSFADFSHSFSLLQPNWPENIFGKTYFMQWEFLILPILAFLSLFFIGNKATRQQGNKERMILFFALLGLVGAFLAKGSNEPLGGVYLWMFEHIPGMVMFRDPTKFYTLIALSYSILIPYSIWRIYDWLNAKCNPSTLLRTRIKNYFPDLFLLLTTCCLLLLIRPAWMGELGGTFKPKEVPGEYVELKNFMVNQPEFFRTFWIPTQQRFTFYSDNHPAINGVGFFKGASASGVINQLKEKNSQSQLSLAGVKYVILPFDSEGEIFIKDRIYDDQQRQVIEKDLNNLPWLEKIQFSNSNNQNKTVVYKTSGFSDRFWLEQDVAADTAKLEWRMINPTKYAVNIKNLKAPSVLVFSENYNSQWVVEINGQKIYSQKVHDRFNSFLLSKGTNGEIVIEFIPQKYVYLGLLMSGFTLFICFLIIIYSI